MSAAPSCAVLGPSAGAVARRALRGAGRGEQPPLLVRWGIGDERRSSAPGLGRRRERRSLAELAPASWEASAEGRFLVLTVPREAPVAAAAEELRGLLAQWGGAVAVAVGLPRCDAVDGVLRIVDELVLVESELPAVTALAEAELRQLSPSCTVVPRPASGLGAMLGGQSGQSTLVAIAAIAVVLAVAVGFAQVASALGRSAGAQGRADVAALAGARALADGQAAAVGSVSGAPLSPAGFREQAIAAARRSAAANRLEVTAVQLLGDPDFPVKIRVTARTAGATSERKRKVLRSTAEVVVAALPAPAPSAGDYKGPLAVRQGQRLRPDVALAFDRMHLAARRSGVALAITSAFRSDAEQAVLFARNPDPKWVAPPGKSLHRLGTELDLGPNSAWGWLAANGPRFGFKKRYSWEPWHFGFTGSPGSASLGYVAPSSGGGEKGAGSAVPAFVPAAYAGLIAKAAQRWGVGAALLGAQLKAESNFNPQAVSGAGAAGIAQFMPATGLAYGLSPAERFDPAKAIDAQAQLMHDLLRQFGSVPLALAAYNAGPRPVQRCGCVPNFPETQAYVQKILAMLGGAGLAAAGGVQVRLVA